MAKVYEVEGTFYVRSGTLEQWSSESVEGRGALRVLGKGEIGWVTGTSDFKIGDGKKAWKDLPYIVPAIDTGLYALRLGTEGAYYSYEDIKSILSDLENVGQEVKTLKTDVAGVKTRLTTFEADLQKAKHIYYDSFMDFPSIGVEGPIYIAKDEDQAYYFNISKLEGEGIGWRKLTGFDVLQCKL